MVKIVCRCVATVLLNVVGLAGHAALYTGLGPGNGTVGTGGDYPTLFAATQAIGASPLTGGDWTLLILNDLEESANSSICQSETNGNNIIIRPAPETSCTITFTGAASGPIHYSVPGHISIGRERYTSGSTVAMRFVPTHNVIIDGCNIPGGNTRNLTLKNVAGAGARIMITAWDNCDFIHIRSLNIESHGTNDYVGSGAFSKTAGVDFRAMAYYDDVNHSSNNCDVINCGITYTGEEAVAAVTLNATLFDVSSEEKLSSNFEVRGNSFSGVATGAQIFASRDVAVDGNMMLLNSGSISQPPVKGVLASGVHAIAITSNTISFSSFARAENRFEGIACQQFSNAFVANNMISGLASFSGGGDQLKTRYGIRNSGERNSTMTVTHNSIDMLQTAGDAGTATENMAAIYCGALAGYGSAGYGRLEMRNNIIRTRVRGGYVILTQHTSATISADYNVYNVDNGAATGSHSFYRLVSLADWQHNTGLDQNSIDMDPFVAASSGLGTWVGPENSAAADLHFTKDPGLRYRMPQIAGVATDIDGQDRSTSMTLVGADEVEPQNSSINSWGLY